MPRPASPLRSVCLVCLAIVGCGAPPPIVDSPHPAAPAGPGSIIFLYRHPGAREDALAVIDVATGARRDLGATGAIRMYWTSDDRTTSLVTVAGSLEGKFVLARVDGDWALTKVRSSIQAISPDGTRAYGDCDAPSRTCVGRLEGGQLVATVAAGTGRDDGATRVVASWRPDGTIVVGHTDDDRTRIELVDGATGATTEAGAVDAERPVVASRDGTRIAWGTSDHAHVAVAALDALAAPRRYDLGDTYGVRCAFADDDRRLVCVHRADGADGDAVDSIELATGAITRLDQRGAGRGPQVSPDGKHVVYAIDGDAGGALARTPVDRAAPEPVTAVAAARHVPLAWLQ